MAWTPWAGRPNGLDDLPLVLAGPILRRTEPGGVTVWVATRTPFTVTLRVFDSTGGTQLMIGSKPTISLGQHLHVVAVTARASPPAASLSAGNTYSYNLYFQEGAIT